MANVIHGGPSAPQGTPAKPAIFFDRDGVINIDYGFVHSPEEFDWMPGAIDAIKWCNDNGFFAIMATNQSGIGRGYFSEDDFRELNHWIQTVIRKHGGTGFDAFYFCPHHPSEAKGKYLLECTCRKPNPGLLLEAFDNWPIIKGKSIMIGDNERDLEAGRRAGIYSAGYHSQIPLDQFVQETVRNMDQTTQG